MNILDPVIKTIADIIKEKYKKRKGEQKEQRPVAMRHSS